MVYESDFYTTRRPYRATPSVSSYTISSTVPSRQIKILPGIGKVHVVHSYDRIIPYIGHKRLTVIPTYSHPHVFRVRPSVIVREIDRITHKARPYIYYTPSLVHSEPLAYFDTEASVIRAQTQLLLKTIHAPVPRVHVPWPLKKISYHYDQLPLPVRLTSDDYIRRMLKPIQSVKQDIYNISHYITEPIRRYVGPSHLACVRYSGDKAYSRRRNLTLREIYAMQTDTVRNDIQLLSYYINANKERKAREANTKASASLNAMRPSRHFNKPQLMLEPADSEEMKELREQRAERLRKIQELEDSVLAPVDLEATRIKRSTKQKEEERLAEERALAEEKAKKEAAAKKEEARRAELARQEALAAQAAAERQAELERKAAEEKAAAAKAAADKAAAEKAAAEKAAAEKAAAEKAAAEAAEKARLEAEKAAAEAAEKARLEEEKRLEEERQQLLRLEEIARQAEEEKERELARQAEELAELARQEQELAEQAKREAELAELAKQEAELAELERQEKELSELDRQEREAAESAKEEAEFADQAVEDAEVAAAENNIPTEEQPAATTDEEPVTSDPEIASPEPQAEAEITGSETEPEPIVEEPDTPEVQEAE